jgi:hypothetical protein
MPTIRKTPVADFDEDPNAELRPYSSPPCYAHEVDPAYFGLPGPCATDQDALRRALGNAKAALAATARALALL